MSLDATQARVAVGGHLYVAPVGTAFPAATTDPWTGFTDVGYLQPDTQSLTPSIDSKDIPTWQSLFPLRTVQTKRGLEFKAALQQTTGTALKLAFGGGSVSSLGGGDYLFAPAARGTVDERALGFEVVDGALFYRLKMYRCIVSDVGDIPFKNDEEIHFDLTVSMLQPASGDPFNILSNDPAMAS